MRGGWRGCGAAQPVPARRNTDDIVNINIAIAIQIEARIEAGDLPPIGSNRLDVRHAVATVAVEVVTQGVNLPKQRKLAQPSQRHMQLVVQQINAGVQRLPAGRRRGAPHIEPALVADRAVAPFVVPIVHGQLQGDRKRGDGLAVVGAAGRQLKVCAAIGMAGRRRIARPLQPHVAKDGVGQQCARRRDHVDAVIGAVELSAARRHSRLERRLIADVVVRDDRHVAGRVAETHVDEGLAGQRVRRQRPGTAGRQWRPGRGRKVGPVGDLHVGGVVGRVEAERHIQICAVFGAIFDDHQTFWCSHVTLRQAVDNGAEAAARAAHAVAAQAVVLDDAVGQPAVVEQAGRRIDVGEKDEACGQVRGSLDAQVGADSFRGEKDVVGAIVRLDPHLARGPHHVIAGNQRIAPRDDLGAIRLAAAIAVRAAGIGASRKFAGVGELIPIRVTGRAVDPGGIIGIEAEAHFPAAG